MRQRRRRRRWLPKVLERINDLAAGEMSADAIHRQLELEAKSGEAGFDADDVPSRRTIHNIVAESTPKDSSGPWSLADAQGDEAELVMPVLQELVEHTEGRVCQLTRDEAKWIAAVHRVVREGPSLWNIYLLAREYQLLSGRGESTAGADAYLAFAPWSSAEAALRYADALNKGRIPWLRIVGSEVPAELEKEDTDDTQAR